jgi:hypothetical protein
MEHKHFISRAVSHSLPRLDSQSRSYVTRCCRGEVIYKYAIRWAIRLNRALMRNESWQLTRCTLHETYSNALERTAIAFSQIAEKPQVLVRDASTSLR